METYSDWLKHFGIPGMKWGQRNGPPYPLVTRQMSREEIKQKKGAAKQYNKELKEAQRDKAYRTAEDVYAKRRQESLDFAKDLVYKATANTKRHDELEKKMNSARLDGNEKKAQKYEAEMKKLDEELAKYTDQMNAEKDAVNKWMEDNKDILQIYKKGNDKVLEILDRAEKEGGLELVEIPNYKLSVGKSIITNLIVNAPIIGMDALMIGAGAPFVALPIALPIPEYERTDRYKVRAGKTIAIDSNADKINHVRDTAETDEEKDRRLSRL